MSGPWIPGRVTWKRYLIGCAPGELGQAVALSVVEQMIGHGRGPGETKTEGYGQSHLEQIPAGTGLTEAAAIIGGLYDLVARENPLLRPALLIDKSAGGTMLPSLLGQRYLSEIVLSTGVEARPLERGGGWAVPRHELVAPLKLATEQGRFKTSSGLPLTDTFTRALQNFTLRAPGSGGDELDRMHRTAEDNLVIAAAMCIWQAERELPPAQYVIKKERKPYDPFREIEG